MHSLDALAGRTTVKNQVIDALSELGPRTSKQIARHLARTPQSPTYQATHKVLGELGKTGVVIRTGLQYAINPEWVREWHVDSKRALLSLGAGQETRVANVRVLFSPDELYATAAELVGQNHEVRIAERTPALFLTSEQNASLARRKYVSTLRQRMSKKQETCKYLFAGDLTFDAIIQEQDVDALTRMAKALQNPQLQVRHTQRARMLSWLITPRDALFVIPSPIDSDAAGFAHLSDFNTDHLSRLYDNLFYHAEDLYSFIARAEKKLTKTR